MYKRIFLLGILVILSCPAVAADFTTPMGRVKDAVHKVISILNNQSLDRESKWRQIAGVIRSDFDFRSISQSVLVRNWRKANPYEQERFAEYITEYIEETYRAKITTHKGEKVIYKSQTIRGDRALVETEIVAGSTSIPLAFKLRQEDGEWYAYDVIIEGVSLVSNYRNTINAIVKNVGTDGLLNNVQKRIDKYKDQQARKTGTKESAATDSEKG